MKHKNKLFTVVIEICACFLATLILFCTVGADNSSNDKNKDKIKLPIIMYHSFLYDKNLQNEYTISPSVLENDLKYFKSNGYETVGVSDIVNYVYFEKALPKKCVMLTFDDGYYNNYYYAYPIIKKYNAKVVISPIVYMTQKYSQTKDISITYGHISISDFKEMLSSGCVEIANHSYNMHSLSPRKGVAVKNGETELQYQKSLSDDVLTAQKYLKDNLSVTPECFVYPFGEESKTTLDNIKKLGFTCTMNCTEKLNYISSDENSLYELGRFLRKQNESIGSLLKRIDKSSN